MTHRLKLVPIAITAVVAGGLIATAAAAEQPMTIAMPPFVEKASDIVVPAGAGKETCTVRFTTLTDERHDPRVIGIAVNRAVTAPDDTQAWLKDILGGLSARGVTPQFDAPAAADTVPTAKLRLKVAWFAPVAIALSGNVVVSIDATTADGRALTRTYRGQMSAMNINNGTGEITSVVNRAFSDALNKMAPDLKGLCQPA